MTALTSPASPAAWPSGCFRPSSPQAAPANARPTIRRTKKLRHTMGVPPKSGAIEVATAHRGGSRQLVDLSLYALIPDERRNFRDRSRPFRHGGTCLVQISAPVVSSSSLLFWSGATMRHPVTAAGWAVRAAGALLRSVETAERAVCPRRGAPPARRQRARAEPRHARAVPPRARADRPQARAVPRQARAAPLPVGVERPQAP